MALNFADRFGGSSAVVDFQSTKALFPEVLTMPACSDGLDEIVSKMQEIVKVVENGFSAAVATEFGAVAHREQDLENIAKITMTVAEKEQYEAFKEGVPLPRFDWNLNKRIVLMEESTRELYVKRAAAMGVIYNKSDVLPEHYFWLAKNWEYALPLVTAVAKVQEFRQDLAKACETLSEKEEAEIRTLRAINGIATYRMDVAYSRLNQRAADIDYCKEILQAREHALQTQISIKPALQGSLQKRGASCLATEEYEDEEDEDSVPCVRRSKRLRCKRY